MPTYYPQGQFTGDSGMLSYDTEGFTGTEGLFSGPANKFTFYIFLQHGDVLNISLHYRIHQPTVDFNNNTEAIIFPGGPFNDILDGTVAPDHGDKNGNISGTIINSGPNTQNGDFRPDRWIWFDTASTFGSVQFDWSWTITHLGDGPGAGTFTQDPSTKVGPSGGGWQAGAA